MSEDLKLDEDDLETILAIGNNEQSGRVTNFELKELVRVYREYSSSQARLSEAVKVLEDLVLAVNDIRGVNIEDYKPAEFAAARNFLAAIGEENEA